MVAPGVAERFRPGTFVTVAVGGTLSATVLRRALPGPPGPADRCLRRHRRVRLRGGRRGYGVARGCRPGTPLDVGGPAGPPVRAAQGAGHLCWSGRAARARRCSARRAAARAGVRRAHAARRRHRGLAVRRARGPARHRGVTVATGTAPWGCAAACLDALPELLGSHPGRRGLRGRPRTTCCTGWPRAAESHGAWSQTAVDVPDLCGTGLCRGCVLPVVGEDGGTRMARACAEGPVFRGDRVRWDDLGTIPSDARGAS